MWFTNSFNMILFSFMFKLPVTSSPINKDICDLTFMAMTAFKWFPYIWIYFIVFKLKIEVIFKIFKYSEYFIEGVISLNIELFSANIKTSDADVMRIKI